MKRWHQRLAYWISSVVLFSLLGILVLTVLGQADSNLELQISQPIGWRSYTDHSMKLSFEYPPSWNVYANVMLGRYEGINVVLLSSFPIQFEPIGHDWHIPDGETALLVSFEGNDYAPSQELEDYAATNLVSPYYQLSGHKFQVGRTSFVEMLGETGRIMLFSQGSNVYGVFSFASNDPSSTALVTQILSSMSPLQDSPIATPKGVTPLKGYGSGTPYIPSTSVEAQRLSWGGPSLKMPWDQSLHPRFSGGPHNPSSTDNDCKQVLVSGASGIDFGMSYEEVLASAEGNVTWGDAGGSIGKYVIVDHGNGWSTRYWHLSQIEPSLPWGQSIPQGQRIGTSGTAGSGPHLHLELRANGSPTTWHGTVIDGYMVRAYVLASDQSQNWNYQGSLTRGTESQNTFTYCNNPTYRWSGSDGTIYAGDGQTVSSTNVKRTDALPGEDTTLPSGYFTSPPDGSTITTRKVVISANASDNTGGSGVKEVRFSAVWAGGEWTGIGTISSEPYSIEWDMCSSGVPDGDIGIELGMEVVDNAGNKFIWSEHGANPHITKIYNCSGDGDGTPIEGDWWNVDWWQNKYLAGYSNWSDQVRWGDGSYPYIDFAWGSSGPVDGWGGDEFSGRLCRHVYFPGGHYDFYADHDDGVRLYVDGELVINAWWDGHNQHADARDLPGGDHEVCVEYYENFGEALLRAYWYGPGYLRPDTEAPNGRITSPEDHSATNQTTLPIWAEAHDDSSGVSKVDFYAWHPEPSWAWHYLGTDTDVPYVYDWDWSALPDSPVWIRIDITDNSGKVREAAGGSVWVYLDQTAPSVSIDSPVDNAYLTSSQVPVLVTAYDDCSAMDSVRFFVGYDDPTEGFWHELGRDTDASDGWSLIWDASSIADQVGVSFLVYGYDNAGNYQGTARGNNTLDRTAPSSAVAGLPAVSPQSFGVSWSGDDATSGIVDYDVQYQDNDGSWIDWQVGVTTTSSLFIGVPDHVYAFRSRARDKAGNLEEWPATPDAWTRVEPESIPGDANHNGHVDMIDYQLLNYNFGTNYPDADFNGNGTVDMADFLILSYNFGASLSGSAAPADVAVSPLSIPNPPTDVSFSYESNSVGTAAIVTLSWSDNADNEDGFALAWDVESFGASAFTTLPNPPNIDFRPNTTESFLAVIPCGVVSATYTTTASISAYNADGSSPAASGTGVIFVPACPTPTPMPTATPTATATPTGTPGPTAILPPTPLPSPTIAPTSIPAPVYRSLSVYLPLIRR